MDLICVLCDKKRLQLLENSVVNDGGGIVNLERRTLAGIQHLQDSCPEVAKTLADIAHYLHDIVEVGGLTGNVFLGS